MRGPAPLLRAALLAAALGAAAALDHGVGLTPAMGWNSWNQFGLNVTDELIRQTAEQLVDLGLVDVGYEYLVIDDGWPNKTRDAQGRMQANLTIFPYGMANLSDYVHSLGLKFGLYSDAGPLTCGGYMGSLGHYDVDAATWAEWGVDYVKFDNCFIRQQDWVVDQYAQMRDALNATGRPIYYSICNWGIVNPWLWGPDIGNSWRTTADIAPNYNSVFSNLDNNVGLAQFAQIGGWNDPDMLEVGNGALTIEDQRSHFALWAAIKAPLIIGTDLRTITPDSLEVLKNRDIIAVSQDPLGVPAERVWKLGPSEIFAGPLEGGDRVVVMFNRHMNGSQFAADNMTFWWELIGLQGNDPMMVRDLYAGQDLGVFTSQFSAAVRLHDVGVYRLTPVNSTGPYRAQLEGWRPWAGQPMYLVPVEADTVYIPPEVSHPTSNVKLCISSFGPDCVGYAPPNCTDADCHYHLEISVPLPPPGQEISEALKGRKLLAGSRAGAGPEARRNGAQ